MRLISCNFTHEDLFVTLTYEHIQTPDSARKEFEKFLRRIRYFCKTNNLSQPRYIAVTERGNNNRLHHHMILSAVSLDALNRLWGLGGIRVSHLDASSDYSGLANYLLKEPKEDGKRWSQSKELRRPIEEKRRISKSTFSRRVRLPKGYTLYEESRRFSEITGVKDYLRAVKFEAPSRFADSRTPPIKRRPYDAGSPKGAPLQYWVRARGGVWSEPVDSKGLEGYGVSKTPQKQSKYPTKSADLERFSKRFPRIKEL